MFLPHVFRGAVTCKNVCLYHIFRGAMKCANFDLSVFPKVVSLATVYNIFGGVL